MRAHAGLSWKVRAKYKAKVISTAIRENPTNPLARVYDAHTALIAAPGIHSPLIAIEIYINVSDDEIDARSLFEATIL